jgi:hypothetical protein
MAIRESSYTAILTSGFETDDWWGHGYLSRVNKVPVGVVEGLPDFLTVIELGEVLTIDGQRFGQKMWT